MNMLPKIIFGLLLSSTTLAAPQVLDRVIAIVDDGVVMESQLDARIATVKNQNKGRSLPPLNILQEQVLERLILESIQLQMADRGGIKISDQQLNDTVKRIARQNGMTLDQFRSALAADGLSYKEAINQIRTEMRITRVQKFQVNNRIEISEQDIDYFLASKAGKIASEAEYRLAHILISVPSQATQSQLKSARKKADSLVTEIQNGKDFHQMAIAHSNGRNALKGGDLGWRKEAQLPSIFAGVVPSLAVGETSQPLKSASGYHILQLADKRGGTSVMVTQSKVRHILVMPNEIRSEADTQSRIQQVHHKLVNGDDFAELAKEYSDDPGSGSSGGDLGWVNPGDMVPAFDQIMQDTQPGQLSKPFKSRFGWHVLLVEDRKETDLGEQVQRNQVRQMLQTRRFDEELPIWLRKVRSEAYVDIKSNSL